MSIERIEKQGAFVEEYWRTCDLAGCTSRYLEKIRLTDEWAPVMHPGPDGWIYVHQRRCEPIDAYCCEDHYRRSKAPDLTSKILVGYYPGAATAVPCTLTYVDEA